MVYTRDSEAPDAFHFWTGVATIAGALRRRVWIDMRKFHWTPNFYIILVGPAGLVTKSTTTRMGLKLLGHVEGIKFGPQSLTWQALTVALEESTEYVEYVDSAGKIKTLPHSSMTISVPELGTLIKTEDSSLVDVLVSMWDGQLETWGHATKHSGNANIINPWLNIIGATTPSWLQNNFPEHMIGGGLASRIVFVYGDAKRHLVPYPDEVTPGPEYYQQEEALIEDLQSIGKITGPYTLDPDARKWGHDWYERLWGTRPAHMASDRYSGYISRKQTHLHKMAIVIAAAQRDERIITKADLMVADVALTDIEHHMNRVFESIGLVDEARHVAEIVMYVRNYKWVTAEQLFQQVRNNMTERDFKTALRVAIGGSLLAVESKPDGQRGLIVAQRTVN